MSHRRPATRIGTGHPASKRSRGGQTAPNGRGFVLFLALGVVAVLFLLAMAASFAAHGGRSVARLQGERDERASIRHSLEALARSSPESAIPPEAIAGARWSAACQAVAPPDSEYSQMKPAEGEEIRVVRLTARLRGADPRNPPAFVQEVLMIRNRATPWTVAAWKQGTAKAPAR